MYPTEPFVRSVLGEFEPELCDILYRAWKRVSMNPDRAYFDLKRTVAVMMHQATMNELRQTYHDSSDIYLMEEHETIRLLIKRKLRVRVKKMDKRGYTSAHRSQMLLALTNVVDEPPLPFTSEDLPEVPTVDFGYVPNELETKIESILVAARFGESVIWSYQADEGGMEAPVPITPAPSAPASSATVIKLPVDRKTRKDDERK